MKFNILSRFFGKQTLGGSHPNCESATLLVSDGERYVPISRYLTVPLSELLAQLRRLDSDLSAESARFPQKGLRRFFFDARTFVKTLAVLRKSISLGKIFSGSVPLNGAYAIADLVRGKKIDAILKERTCFKNILTLITIPYEDKGGLEDARLKDCPAVFAYEDVETGKIRTTAFCSWQTIKDDVCRKIQAHYGPQTRQEELPPRKITAIKESRS
jgi:hypothetical protein